MAILTFIHYASLVNIVRWHSFFSHFHNMALRTDVACGMWFPVVVRWLPLTAILPLSTFSCDYYISLQTLLLTSWCHTKIYRFNASVVQQHENMLWRHCKQSTSFAVDIRCDWVPTDGHVSKEHYSQSTQGIHMSTRWKTHGTDCRSLALTCRILQFN